MVGFSKGGVGREDIAGSGVGVCACGVCVCVCLRVLCVGVCVCLCACVCVCVFLWRTLTTQQGPLAEGGSPVVPAKGGAFERTLILGTLCFCF